MNAQQEIINSHRDLFRVGKKGGCSDGLWYDSDGNWTGLINDLTEGSASALPMGPNPIFRTEGHHWISATDTLDNLRNWFSVGDMRELLAKGYEVLKVSVSGYRRFFFEGFAHEVFSDHQVNRIDRVNPALLYTSLRPN